MQDQGTWDDCPSGVVAEMAGRLRRRKRQTQMRPFVFLGVTALLLSAIGYGVMSRDTAGSLNLNCSETAALFAKYHDDTLGAAKKNAVREHLSRCPKCREHYDEQYPSEVRTGSSAPTAPLAMASQFRR